MRQIILEKVEICERMQSTERQSVRATLKQYLDEAHIGTLQLVDGTSVALNMWDGDFVIPRGNRIAQVPSFDVLKNGDALVSYLNKVTQLKIKSLSCND